MRLQSDQGPSYVSPRQLGGGAPAPTVPKQFVPGAVLYDQRRVDPQGGFFSKFAPGSGGGGGAPPGSPPGAPPAMPPPAYQNTGIVPQTVGGASWPQQWQSQQSYQQQTVSVPVTVVTQPQLSNYFTPPQPSGDLGPMGSVGEAVGIQGANNQKCLTWGLAGLALAWILSGRRSKHAQAG